MKLEDPQLATLVDAFREANVPSDATRRQMRTRLDAATARRPAWQVYGMAAALAAAALLLIWAGARLGRGNPQQHVDGAVPAQAPHGARSNATQGEAKSRDTSQPTAKRPPDEALPETVPIDPPAPVSPKRPPASPTSRTMAAPVAPPEVELDELALIAEAEAALRAAEPERALQLLRRHERQHPTASTTVERTALRVLALCALGRIEEGRGLRHTFLRDHADSAYRSRIHNACPRP